MRGKRKRGQRSQGTTGSIESEGGAAKAAWPSRRHKAEMEKNWLVAQLSGQLLKGKRKRSDWIFVPLARVGLCLQSSLGCMHCESKSAARLSGTSAALQYGSITVLHCTAHVPRITNRQSDGQGCGNLSLGQSKPPLSFSPFFPCRARLPRALATASLRGFPCGLEVGL